MKYTVYIFDFDFTLADATAGIVESVNYALNKLGTDSRGCEDIRKTVGMTLKETFLELTGITDDRKADQFALLFKEKSDIIMTDGTVLFDDTAEVLSALKQRNCKTGIVTSKFHYRIDETLKKFGITRLVDCIVGFEDVKTAKPSPEGLLMALELLGAGRRSVLYIGDSIIDAKTAAGASVDFAAVVTGTTGAREFESLPNVCVADSLTEILRFAER